MITSSTNPLVKRIRKLRDRRERWSQRAFVVEGVQPVWRAHEAGADIETLVVAPDLLADSPAEALIRAFERAGSAVANVSAEIFCSISDRDGPAGVAAIVRMPTRSIDALAADQTSVFVGLYEVADPGNLGTIIRTADSFGIAGVVLVGATADPYAPRAVKASMGSLFAVPVVSVDSIDVAFEWAATNRTAVVTTSARASMPLPVVDFPRPSLVLFGSEGSGLPADVIARGEADVAIPMLGTATSLNLAVAAGIVLYFAMA